MVTDLFQKYLCIFIQKSSESFTQNWIEWLFPDDALVEDGSKQERYIADLLLWCRVWVVLVHLLDNGRECTH
jgi:hypothetical protein